MSYILDAIKKSEAERGQGSIPGLQTVHSSSLNYKTDSRQLWPYIIIGLLLINIAGLVFYYTSNNSENVPVTNTEYTSSAQSVEYAAPTKPQMPTTQTIIRTAAETREINITTSEPIIDNTQIEIQVTDTTPLETTRSPSNNEVIHIGDLPSNIKEHIPHMKFSGHVYSSSPLQRSIIINGSFMEEGDNLNNYVTLTEITSRGAIFNFEDILFEVNVLTGWDVN